MLCVKNKIKESNIHGIGLFADQLISKGTLVWKFTPGFDQKFTKEQILALPIEVQIYLSKYVWLSKNTGLYCLSSDNGKYFNHSESPNVRSEYDGEDEVRTYAIQDIQPGEEILDNYSTFEDLEDEDFFTKIIEKYHLDDEVDPRIKNAT